MQTVFNPERTMNEWAQSGGLAWQVVVGGEWCVRCTTWEGPKQTVWVPVVVQFKS